MTGQLRVFRVRGDVNSYQALLADDEAVWSTDRLALNGTPRASNWQPPTVYSDQPRLLAPDIWTLVGCAGLVFPPPAQERFDLLLAVSGELLPLPFEGEVFFLHNNLQDINCLNVEASGWLHDENGRRVLLKRYEFHSRRLPESSLFKIPQTDTVEVLCIEGLLDPEEDFKAIVEHEGWTGLRFEPLWQQQPSR